MKQLIKKLLVVLFKQFDLGSAIAVRLTKLTGKSKVKVHPKHLISENPWFIKYLTSKDQVLDLGCGNGQNAIKTAKVSSRVIGLEINDELLEDAKLVAKTKRIINITFEKADLEGKLHFKNNVFDKILFLDVLEHLVKRDQILQEIRRVLKPRGLLFLGVPNSDTSWKKLQRSVDLNSLSDPDHKVEFSEKSIRDLLKKHNFKIINFGYGKYDTPLRGIADIIGGFSVSIYRKISNWRARKTGDNSQEASGFEIVARKL